MRNAGKRIVALTKRNLLEIVRDPLSLMFLIAMPLGMLVLFYFLFHRLTPQFEMRYLAPGIIVFSQAFLSLFVGLLISMDRASAFLTRLYVTPARSYEFVLGYTLAMIPVGLLQSALFFVVAGIIDPSFFSVHMLLGMACSLLTALLFIGSGILLGSLCGEKSIGGVSSIVIAGQSVLSGMWFPLEGLSRGMIAMMNALPFRPSAQFIQNMVLGSENRFDDIVKPFLTVLAYTVIVFVVAIFAYRQKMKER